MVAPKPGRPTCPQCGLHPNICVCDRCRPVPNRTPVTVLQHPSEVGRAKGTLRILQRCLGSVRVLVGETAEQFELAGLASGDLTRTGLLFPGPTSQPLEQADLGAIDHWLVLDGTWRKAARILHQNPALAELPRYHFAQPPTSRYVVRKAPGDHHLATAEAVSYLLKQAEPDLDTGPIDDAMTALVEQQLAQIPAPLRHRYPKPPPA
ncbi:MAG: tRNA-uridine aminocarboxypropyltransferase [Pseudomonadota bacterium]|nr:tRNA-uridine aminocarboxypropyltransferase [Pseudomonadota bacterium]